ncbi:DUF5017 domain-containing protein [Arundinibacter roseus]|uniref:DUF5017 domain-containing protein n=1 Tax=Arundinibacter roseus TaxID=2070510 RepID=A0A4V2X981_9BACT|nr:hypothetical protein [Arundinibacter roseus]TDB62775.1 hypothetical protein EZE20_17735 [Arundinibacter roseus]
MKSFKNICFFAVAGLLLASCENEELAVDVPFSVDKVTTKVGETVTFTVGAGANLSSIYTGDAGKDYDKSRINLVEMKGFSEDYLRNNLVATRLPDLKEYFWHVPDSPTLPANMSLSKGNLTIYDGKLVAWDVSNSTNSNYLSFEVPNEPITWTIKPENAVLPAMLRYNNATLSGLGALNTVANNAVSLWMSFPDGFTKDSQQGTSMRYAVQFVIDGKASAPIYLTGTFRELLQATNINLQAAIAAWLTANPTANAKAGIDEIRITLNADNPATTDDDGDLLNYVGKVYIQEIRVGAGDNMIKAFDKGFSFSYIYPGTTRTFEYKYTKAGTYKATLVSTFVGRKQYSGDGYQTNRPEEISASEYPLERRIKSVQIVVE